MNNSKIDIYLSSGSAGIVESMKRIDVNVRGILFIVDDGGRLTGTVTDGDIRRWIIRTGNLSAPICQVMNAAPKYLFESDKKKAFEYMKANFIRAVPILDVNGKISDIIFETDDANERVSDKKILQGSSVIIMAGGKGTRLYPYTRILPKPLIPIGDIPIIERIINRFCEYGISEYFLTVNYKKSMIRSYFTDLDPSYEIHYVEENIPLGTAGSIRLIDKKFHSPVFVTNCDILIDADYSNILAYHKDSGNAMTIVSALKNTVIPYGVLHAKEKGIITSMEEKPMLSNFINTGMYIVDPDLLVNIPKDTVFHMTDFAALLMREGYQVGMYPVSEDSFLDMGEFEEMHRMEEKLNLRME